MPEISVAKLDSEVLPAGIELRKRASSCTMSTVPEPVEAGSLLPWIAGLLNLLLQPRCAKAPCRPLSFRAPRVFATSPVWRLSGSTKGS